VFHFGIPGTSQILIIWLTFILVVMKAIKSIVKIWVLGKLPKEMTIWTHTLNLSKTGWSNKLPLIQWYFIACVMSLASQPSTHIIILVLIAFMTTMQRFIKMIKSWPIPGGLKWNRVLNMNYQKYIIFVLVFTLVCSKSRSSFKINWNGRYFQNYLKFQIISKISEMSPIFLKLSVLDNIGNIYISWSVPGIQYHHLTPPK